MDRSIRTAKRVTDILGSSFALALTLPLYPLIAAAIYLESPGSVFIRQERAGQLCDPEPAAPGTFAVSAPNTTVTNASAAVARALR